ncbi:MAG: ActS/PrrB/RegB family redox-sensitive histidine kinase [Alphaproteobacteria bacterium]|nr:ActS/PrrB/RegB family redox-sensitive histidine kinase [Alphaproteobacteria bacterium]
MTRLPAEPGRVRLGTLSLLRWFAIAGQSFAILIVHFGLGYDLPLLACLGAIEASVILNIVLALRYRASRRLSDGETTALLAFDQLQLTVLLYLTGGIENPFALMFIAPAAISASSLNLRNTIALGTLSFAFVTFLAVAHEPLPWEPGKELTLPPLFVGGIWIAIVLGIGFTAVVAFRVATEATRMSAALAATQLALAKEHRLSSLGALAASAAHELGTPLGTISVIAKELSRETPPDSPNAEELRLLLSQVSRCRDILARLAHHDADDPFAMRAPFAVVLEEAAAPYQDGEVEIRIEAEGDGDLTIMRQPELVHGLANIIENATDFAERRVQLRARWTPTEIRLEVLDDGPGFSPDVIARLGEPYVTTRPGKWALTEEDLGPSAPGDGHEGMGLGFFIAKTLLERTGASVTFGNRPEGGARVTMAWRRSDLETMPELSAS